MRGKASSQSCKRAFSGITPAYAGKSRCNLPSTAPWKDHPRVCGEKGDKVKHCFHVLGSPPRMRGKVATLSRIVKYMWDHPRVCGEKADAVPPSPALRGSPPRMRGKAVQMGIRLVQPGITPAYAGKSSAHNMASVIRKDHPRVCGEKASQLHAFGFIVGSPPRVRGKDSAPQVYHRQGGIIPACAGKSSGPPQFAECAANHPRVCGEKLVSAIVYYTQLGSPPRMRGKVNL